VGARRPVDYEGRIAAVYEAGRDLTPEAEAAWRDAVRPYIGPHDAVVDVGAGTGRFTRRLAALTSTTVTAVEPAGGMRAARRRGRAGPVPAWVAGRAESLPLRDRSADLAWVSFVLHYLEVATAGRELARVLRPGGRVLLWSVFPDRFDDLAWLRWFPAARAIDEARMPTVDRVRRAWRPVGLRLRSRTLHPMLVAHDLGELAERISRRAVSTLELISDADFAGGLDAMRRSATTAPPAPVFSPHELLVFTR
jgi:ubiquinone/menaquinone biosynthesis C-methylase UbiE